MCSGSLVVTSVVGGFITTSSRQAGSYGKRRGKGRIERVEFVDFVKHWSM